MKGKNMRLYKRIASIVLCFAMLLVYAPTTALAAEPASGTCGEGVNWSYNEGVLTISGTGEMTNYQLLNERPWNAYDPEITQVIIEDGVTSISDGAFYNCTGLTEISLSNSLTSIGDKAFWGCIGLTEISLSNSLTSIGKYVFNGCTGLTNIVIPNSVTSIGYGAFNVCTKLKIIDIPTSVTSIDEWAFAGCTGLTTIEIPDSVTSIGGSAFADCTSLTNIVIPNSVTSIGGGAFYGCTGLTTIEIPDSVTSIEGSAFYGCTGLTTIEIPDSVISIEGSAFSGCTGLTTIEIPDSVTSIGDRAFRGCTELTTIDIPNSVTSIGENIFYECTKLSIIHYLGSIEEWDSITKASSNNDLDKVMANGGGHFCESVPNNDGQTHTWSCLVPVCEGYEKTETHNFSKGKCSCGVKGTLTAADFMFTAPTDLIYSAENKEATVVVRDGITGVGEITIKYYKNGVEAIPNQVGSYTVQILVSEGENYKSAELSSDNWAFDISYLSTPEEATLSGIVGSNGWYVGNVNLVAPDQFTISVDGDTYLESITYDSDMDESITYYLKDSQGYIALKNITIKKDTTLPTVLYRIGSDEWKQFVNAITFGIFCKDYTTVEIKAADAMSGVQKIEYYVANQEMSDLELEAATWDVYNGALDLDVAGKYIIYVRVTDMAGNVTEDSFATEGIVIYKDSTVTSPASREYKAGTDLNITYTSNGNTLNPVLYYNDQPLNMGLDADYAFAANAEVVTFTRAFLDSLGAGTHEITFVFHPQGVETTAVTIEKTLTLTVTPAPLTIESATVTGREYNGTKDVAVTGLTISGIKDTDIVGVSFDNLTGTLTSANAGTYTSVIFGDLSDVVTLTGDDASNYELVYASGTAVATNVTIAEGPHIENEEGKMGWDAILDEVEDVLTSEEENTVLVDMNGQSMVPADVLEEIKGKDIEVKFDLGDGIVWTVNGADITGMTLEDMDFAVTVNTEENPNQNIPVSVINKVTGEKSHVEISLAHDGEFGFTAVLTLNLNAENAGLFANLYYYNPTKQAMEFICADEIAADGTTDLTFTHASDYTIVIDEVAADADDSDTPANSGGAVTPDGSQPPQTGDSTDITLWAMLLMAGLGLVAFGQKKHVR